MSYYDKGDKNSIIGLWIGMILVMAWIAYLALKLFKVI
jgi:hypothetical protein